MSKANELINKIINENEYLKNSNYKPIPDELLKKMLNGNKLAQYTVHEMIRKNNDAMKKAMVSGIGGIINVTSRLSEKTEELSKLLDRFTV